MRGLMKDMEGGKWLETESGAAQEALDGSD